MKRSLSSLCLLAVCALFSLLALGGCGSASDQTSATTTSSNTTPQIVHLDMSWSKNYHTLKDLKQDAGVAVHGTITRIINQEVDSAGIPYTNFEFTVSHIAHDPAKSLTKNAVVGGATRITIHQTGGVVNNTHYESSDDPLFQVGEQYILFLKEYKPGFYYVIGGPTGRFKVQNGAVSPMNNDGVPFSGSQDDFDKNLQNA
ncbi:hypothetical protein [Ktedonobacter robiniae]|uniref:ABC transporter substrate-binding protein n=1 Tax=Ktedonobacter robiniae TaxID=2778365 RepID=A0ABQ3UHA3_9CHLR|nr:hypothetical protein [Ktedonobacter robiniae]GHO51965.1 hypothetical protein KSB_04400 [Ktedonobacter robiniae]